MIAANNIFLFIAFALYLIAAIVYLFKIWFNTNRFPPFELLLLIAAVLFHFGGLVHKTIALQRLPLCTMNDFILVFCWVLALGFIIASRKYQLDIIGSIIAPMEVILMAYALPGTSAITLVPALQSMWLEIHVITAVIAYSFLALSFAAAILLLVLPHTKEQYISVQDLDKFIYKCISAGFPFLTLLLITGAIWAEEVWGTWWGWDPKETWALITWFIYAIYLHFRRTRQWNSKLAAQMAVLGFSLVIFTLFGVSLLLPGLHSY